MQTSAFTEAAEKPNGRELLCARPPQHDSVQWQETEKPLGPAAGS
jgi:hypothetical protein